MDMDAFFASVEQRDKPALRGRPVVVGGPARRGVVCSASYEARRHGIKNGQPMAQALRLCPRAVVVSSGLGKYREVSREVHAVLRAHSPLVESVGFDEAYLDVTGVQRLLGPPEWVGRSVRRAVRERTGLPCSVGVAPNKLLAKMGSGLAKPDGLLVLGESRVKSLLPTLPVGRLRGVGPALEGRLTRLGIATVGDLLLIPRVGLRRRFGAWGEMIWQRARGLDSRPVTAAPREPKTMGRERTFSSDLIEREALRGAVWALGERLGRDLRGKGAAARGVRLKVRFADFHTFTRQAPLPVAVAATRPLVEAALGLLAGVRARRGIRLLGVAATPLCLGGVVQPTLFDERPEEDDALDNALDLVAARHGPGAVARGAAWATR